MVIDSLRKQSSTWPISRRTRSIVGFFNTLSSRKESSNSSSIGSIGPSSKIHSFDSDEVARLLSAKNVVVMCKSLPPPTGTYSTSASETEILVGGVLTLSWMPLTRCLHAGRVTDLCKAVQIEDQQSVGYFGYVRHEKRRFWLYASSTNPSHLRRKITLRQTIDGSQTSLPPFYYPEMIKIALTLSISVLHLYDTPWLAKRLD